MKASLTKKQIRQLVEAGARAPSGGNIQPWLVTSSSNTLTVSLDPNKLGSILDVNNFGSIFSLGSFVKNIEVTSSSLGLIPQIDLLHKSNLDLFSCQISFQSGKTYKHPLHKSVFARETNRKLSTGSKISDAIITKISKNISSNPSFSLQHIHSNKDKKIAASILGKADVIRTKHTKLLSEMMSEIRWNDTQASSTKDGIDIKTMELPGNIAKMLQLLAKHPSLGKSIPDIAIEKQSEPLLLNCSHLCCFTITKKPTPKLVFQAGQHMQHLWLLATKEKLSVHPWTVITFFCIRARYFSQTAFSERQESQLLKLDSQLKKLFQIPINHTPFFIFRISKTQPATTKSLRLDWQQFLTPT